MIIRAARPQDFEAWLPLWHGYNAFYGREGETALPHPITKGSWARFFDPLEPMHCFVAERDGILLGLAHIVLHRSTILLGPTCYLQDLFTAPEARGQGVGRALIEAVYAFADERDIGRVYWVTQASNAAGRALYDKVAEHPGVIVYRRVQG
jgi:GNAT superfamily N-acetyltransferase